MPWGKSATTLDELEAARVVSDLRKGTHRAGAFWREK